MGANQQMSPICSTTSVPIALPYPARRRDALEGVRNNTGCDSQSAIVTVARYNQDGTLSPGYRAIRVTNLIAIGFLLEGMQKVLYVYDLYK